VFFAICRSGSNVSLYNYNTVCAKGLMSSQEGVECGVSPQTLQSHKKFEPHPIQYCLTFHFSTSLSIAVGSRYASVRHE